MNILLTTCENPDILRLIYLAKKILNLAFILIPIALIIFVIIDVFKNVVEADNEKTALRIVTLVMNSLTLVGLNSEYKKCIDNATKEKIAEYQKIYDAEEKQKERKNGFSHSG